MEVEDKHRMVPFSGFTVLRDIGVLIEDTLYPGKLAGQIDPSLYNQRRPLTCLIPRGHCDGALQVEVWICSCDITQNWKLLEFLA